MNKTILILIVLLLSLSVVFAQDNETDIPKLFAELKAKDSLIFNLGFAKCDTAQLRMLISEDLEFYHDQNGLLASKEMLIQNIPNLCRMDYKAVRVLVDSTLQVFPLYANGTLYGAIQTGIHEFYGEEEDKPRYLTSTAKFTHVWILEEGEWKLKRILSYDHVVPEN